MVTSKRRVLRQVQLHDRIASAAAESACAAAAAVALAPAAALAVAAAAAAAVAVAPAAAIALAPAAAVALAASIAGLDLLRGVYFWDCDDIKLLVLVSKRQWGYDTDVLAVRVQVRVPRVRGSGQPGGALPFTSIAIATMDRLPSAAAAVALTPAAARAVRVRHHQHRSQWWCLHRPIYDGWTVHEDKCDAGQDQGLVRAHERDQVPLLLVRLQ